jgi:hypothetical protein
MDIDSDFAVIEKADYCIALCSRDEPYTLDQQADLFVSKCTNILVYAETIALSGSIKLPGKNLSLIANNLTVTGDVTVNVSGANGGLQPSVVVGSGAAGADGQNAGSVFVCVENSNADLGRLRVRAIGGDGGQGGATSDSNGAGGAGGKGGDAGKSFLNSE